MIVFLHIPKTAGSTFQFILENTFGFSACHTNHNKRPLFDQADFAFARRVFPRVRSLAGHNLLDPLSLDAPGAFHVTFLREPIARVISHYQDSVLVGGESWTFEEFLRHRDHENLHVRLMAGAQNLSKAKKYLERCSFVGLTERFDLSLQVLKSIAPYRLNLNYTRRRVSRTIAIRRQITNDPRLMDLARERNQLDIALYDFAVKEIFPKFCEKAGVTADTHVPSFENYATDRHWRYRFCHTYNLLFYRHLGKLRGQRAWLGRDRARSP